MLGKIEGKRRKGATEDEMIRWHHWLNGHEFEQTPGDRQGQGSLAFCRSWGRRVRHDLATEQQNNDLAFIHSNTVTYFKANFDHHLVNSVTHNFSDYIWVFPILGYFIATNVKTVTNKSIASLATIPSIPTNNILIFLAGFTPPKSLIMWLRWNWPTCPAFELSPLIGSTIEMFLIVDQ